MWIRTPSFREFYLGRLENSFNRPQEAKHDELNYGTDYISGHTGVDELWQCFCE
jgi:hypothetical protein